MSLALRAIHVHARTLSLVLAVAVAQAPFCALACIEAETPEHVADVAAPCHGEPAEPLPDSGQPESHYDCGCETTVAALGPKDASLDPPNGAWVSPAPSLRAAMHAPSKPANGYQVEIPPPDLLLRNSTLLL